MKIKHLKTLRVIIGISVFLLMSLFFIDAYDVLPKTWAGWTAEIQFIPALLALLNGSIIAGIIVAGILLLTLAFGRVYCSTLCPLGIYQDIVIRIKKRLARKHRFKFKHGNSIVHYTLTAIVFIALFFGVTSLIILLDPYSNFGRMAADTFRPPILQSLNFTAHRLHNADIYWLNPVNYPLQNAMIYAALFTVFISVLSWTRGRLFCNLLCPVGGILSVISRKSFFKLKIDNSGCTSCGKCMHNCKAECISVKDKSIDYSRCIACYNCVDACETNSIDFELFRTNTKQVEEESEIPNERRKVLAKAAGTGLSLLALPVLAQNRHGKGEHKGHYHNRGTVTPPGSYSLKHFNENCTACHLCVAKCPANVLQPTVAEYGLSYMLQPKMNFDTGYCTFNCTLCGEICPTNAIQPLSEEEKHVSQIGRVHFSRRLCIVESEGTSCGSCSEHCPTQAVYMVPYGDNLTIPEINPDICIGCGACEHACPVTEPHKAIFVESNQVHLVADKPKEEQVDFDVNEDFPF